MPWSYHVSRQSWQTWHEIAMNMSWWVVYTMFTPWHSMILMFDNGCQFGESWCINDLPDGPVHWIYSHYGATFVPSNHFLWALFSQRSRVKVSWKPAEPEKISSTAGQAPLTYFWDKNNKFYYCLRPKLLSRNFPVQFLFVGETISFWIFAFLLN